MACLDSAANDQEVRFTTALNASTSFGLSGDTLTLYVANAPRVRFVR
jgi:heat shock protein HslJ